MRYTRLRPAVLAALLAAALLALAMTACGGSDEDGSGGGGSRDDGAAQSESGGGSDEEQIRALYAQYMKDTKVGDPSACAVMTSKAQKQLDSYVGDYRSCPQALRNISRRIKDARQITEARVIKVVVDGNQAKMSLNAKGYGSNAILFAKRGGEWKVHDTIVTGPGSGRPSGGGG